MVQSLNILIINAIHWTMMTKSAVIMQLTGMVGLRRSKRVVRVLAVNTHLSTAISILAKVRKITCYNIEFNINVCYNNECNVKSKQNIH